MAKFENKKFTWDTTKNLDEYPGFIRKEFIKLSILFRKQFVKWISDISKNNKNNINWWFKIPSSRDPNKSELYKNIIILKVLSNKKINRKIRNLIIGSKVLEKTIKKNKLFNQGNIKILNKWTKKKILFNNLKSFIFLIFIFILTRIIKKKKINLFRKINLIDTYLDHRLKKLDIVYSNLNNIFSNSKKNNSLFLCNYIQTNKLFNVIKNTSNASRDNFIFKEHYFNFYQYLKIILEVFFVKVNPFKIKLFSNLDLSILINDELYSKKDFFSEFQARIKLKFIKKISLSKVSINKAISRFENQCVDRAFNYGIRKYFPDTILYGFQGFLYYPHLEHQNPIKIEEEAKLLPKKIIVTSKTVIAPRKEFYKNINFLLGPSLGKQNIFKDRKIKKKYKYLVALCGIQNVDQTLLNWTKYIMSKSLDTSFLIKPHPTLPITNLKFQSLNNFHERFKVVNNNIAKLLELSEFVITSGPTSIIYEALVYECKLMYLVLDYNDVLLSKKIKSLNNNINYINSKDELFSQMVSLNKKKYRSNTKNLKRLFYTKLNKKNISFFY